MHQGNATSRIMCVSFIDDIGGRQAGSPDKIVPRPLRESFPPASHHRQNINDFPFHFSCLNYTDDFLQIHERRILTY